MQRLCNTTARALTKIFRIGENKGDRNRERVMDTYTTDTVSIPPLAMMPKDHKSMVGSVPAVRPVCLCTSSINLRASDILSEVLTPIAREEGKNIESESTEESIYYVDKANKEIREELERGIVSDTDIIIGSMDVEALYPSIQVNRSASIVSEMVQESEIVFENVDYDTAVRYIASK